MPVRTTDCRSCGTPLVHTFADLGMSPVSNAFIRPEAAHEGEMFYPLHALVCDQCWLVQLSDVTRADEHFHDDYVYYSSYSSSWVEHARCYVEAMTSRFGFGGSSRVVEIASNDGYLLQHFVKAGIPCLGVEPTANTAAAARSKGVPTREMFLGRKTGEALAADGWSADLLLGNNVLAHVPDLHDFVAGLALVLKADGVLTMEFPHLLRLIAGNQFDTIYHEHFSYLSLLAVEKTFSVHGLELFDVEEFPTHGGSLRIFAQHCGGPHAVADRLQVVRRQEAAAELDRLETYTRFATRIHETKQGLLRFLLDARAAGKTVVGYGAPAKGNTLLNYCGIRGDFLEFTVDASPHKQGRFLPGSRIPVFAPERLRQRQPDYVLILPWNLVDEIATQHSYIREWGGRFVVPVPAVRVLP